MKHLEHIHLLLLLAFVALVVNTVAGCNSQGQCISAECSHSYMLLSHCFNREKSKSLKDSSCLLLELSTMVNIWMTVTVPINGSGYQSVNGSWIGLAGDMKSWGDTQNSAFVWNLCVFLFVFGLFSCCATSNSDISSVWWRRSLYGRIRLVEL